MFTAIPGTLQLEELSELVARDEAGLYVTRRPLQAEEVLKVSEAIVAEHMVRESRISAPDAAGLYFNRKLALLQVEQFCAAFLDNQHGVIAFEVISVGTINSTTVFPREVVKSALRNNAAAVIFAHNHPSGSTEPSHADIQLTQLLVSALRLVDIRVVDHLIIAGNQTTSMATLGLV